MGTEWRSVAELEAAGVLLVQDGNHGAYRPVKEEIVEHGIPHVRAADIDEIGRIDFDGAQQINEVAYARIRKGRGQPGDVLFTHKGTVGRIARVPPSAAQFLCSPQTTFWRSLRPDMIDPGYLHAFLRSDAFMAQVRRRMHETDMAPYVSLSVQRQLLIALPPLPEQRAIADVLGALDEKIESNRRTANAARAVLMQAPPSTGESSPLDQAADFHNGGALTKHATGSGRPILRIRELRAGVTADTPRTDAPVRETHEVAAGDLLFSWSGTLLTTRWRGEPAVLNQHVFRVDSRPGLSRWFVEAWIERHVNTFRAIAADKATTMGHIQRHHLSEALVALPPHDEIDALMRTYDPLDHLRMSLLAEADRLIAIRDALLPRLVSGRIRVPLAQEPEAALDTVLDVAAETSMRVT